ncbi:phytase [Massilia sp. S19_KUP03_FR1]|uniref:phytase n=1 Tax=Massilia sp. S19_KUP03_FR1 TaxID=3025503 RepID=UPI002FCD8D55
MAKLIQQAALAGLLVSSLAAAAPLPGLTAKARELAALPDGGWLTLDKQGLHLLDSAGQQRAVLPIRAKQLDLRPLDGGVLAVLLDANAERALPVLVDLKAGRLTAQAPLPAPAFGIEAICLYRDAQQLDHVFMIGKDGSSEQWALTGAQPQLVRKLAMPTHVKHCRADDGAHTLFVSEGGIGLWAYDANAEGGAAREPVALRAPFGKLAGGAGALTVLPDGVAVLDAKGATLHLLHRDGAKWTALPSRAGGGAEQLASRSVDGRLELLLPEAKGWTSVAQTWRAAARPAARPIAIVMPEVQTEPVARQGDAADDPAIWVDRANAAGSRILGTNKKQGLLVYDLQGKQTQLLEVGRLNNVDLRQDIAFAGQRVDLAAATQRDDNSLMLFTIDARGTVAESIRIATGLNEIYGMCLYRPVDGGLQAFVNDKDGRFQQYRIDLKAGQYSGTLLRTFKVASQPEGCVVDDKRARLFLGEEKRGVWTTSADTSQPDALKMVLPVGADLAADVEGMALYQAGKADYLIVSSQGDNSYVVLDAAAPFAVRGRFRVGFNLEKGIDGTSETDGLDVSTANFGGAFSQGMLVIQDGYKRLPDGPQNFKYVGWGAVAKALGLQ